MTSIFNHFCKINNYLFCTLQIKIVYFVFQIPPTSQFGSYKLKVEGDVHGVLGGTAFSNETDLQYSQRSMTIFIQTDKPIYKQGETGKFNNSFSLTLILDKIVIGFQIIDSLKLAQFFLTWEIYTCFILAAQHNADVKI